jgi:tetratricopeptide (TPR) repeat protein
VVTLAATLALGWGWYQHVIGFQNSSQRSTTLPTSEPSIDPPVLQMADARPTSTSTDSSAKDASIIQPPTPGPFGTQSPSTLGEALSLLDRGQTQQGIAMLEALAVRDPNNTQVLMELGMAYSLDLKSPAKARVVLEKILDINPDYRAALNELELVYSELGANDEGLAFLQLKIQQNPASLELRYLYGRMLAISDPGDAISWLKSAAEITDLREDALANLAQAALKSGQLELAIASWSESLLIAERALSQAVSKGETGLNYLEDRIASTKIELDRARKQASKKL